MIGVMSPVTVIVTPATVSLSRRRVIWAASLTVTAGAAALTAHGLYEVAVASRVPPGMAWLYPAITDGLALVAYAATRTLGRGTKSYAWAVVILAAGLSGVAQAAFLAGSVTVTPMWLRFGVGAWPAVAAMFAAHLVYLLAPRASVLSAAATPVAVPVSPPRPAGTAPATPAVSSVPLARKARDTDLKAARLRDTPTIDEGMSYPDIARELGVSVRTARRAVGRGRTSTADPPVSSPGGEAAPTPHTRLTAV
jgi:hypothetical protein